MQYAKGDLFESKSALAHCVSADLKMGAGIALAFRNKFDQVENLKKQDKKVGSCAFIVDSDRYIFYLITKEKYWAKPTYASLTGALKDLYKLCCKYGITKISMPKIGCGLDRLEWPLVAKIIKETMGDINITVYEL